GNRAGSGDNLRPEPPGDPAVHKGARTQGDKGRHPGSGPQGRDHRGFDRFGLSDCSAVASGKLV
ncbi:MAG: hypothetical protein AVDCRST_MAG78-3372, partial [uncultured Rubrobacteraceae bacterium]